MEIYPYIPPFADVCVTHSWRLGVKGFHDILFHSSRLELQQMDMQWKNTCKLLLLEDHRGCRDDGDLIQMSKRFAINYLDQNRKCGCFVIIYEVMKHPKAACKRNPKGNGVVIKYQKILHPPYLCCEFMYS